MDERVKELLDRVKDTASTLGETAGSTARRAGKAAGQMVDVAKLNMKIFDLKTDINGLLREIGQMVYDTHAGINPDTASMEGLLAQIDEKRGDIAQLKGRIGVLRSARQCPACGGCCGKEDKYCRQCGVAL